MKKRKIRRLSFEDRVMFVVRNFIEYGNYKKSPENAVRVIQKHHPEKTRKESRETFLKYVNIHNEIISFVGKNLELYRKQEVEKQKNDSLNIAEIQFILTHSDIPEDIIRTMIWYIFDWHHVR